MGLDTSSVILLCAAKMMGADFSSVAMIGRQSFFPSHETLRRVFATLGIDRDARQFLQAHDYGEGFLELLGATNIDSIDVSPYEGATIVHDMNRPIPSALRERFTLVHDGGTIEHVFDIAQALKNCMEMVRVGGYFTQVNIANNYTGHGFWQISPETIFRAFSPENGYQVEAVLMHEVVPRGRWYLVFDPDQIGRRVELCNSNPTYILTIAKRTANGPVFQKSPQQSDYVSLWERTFNRSPPATAPAGGAPRKTWRRFVPKAVKRVIRGTLERVSNEGNWSNSRGFSKTSYQRIQEDDVLHGRLRRSVIRDSETKPRCPSALTRHSRDGSTRREVAAVEEAQASADASQNRTGTDSGSSSNSNRQCA